MSDSEENEYNMIDFELESFSSAEIDAILAGIDEGSEVVVDDEDFFENTDYISDETLQQIPDIQFCRDDDISEIFQKANVTDVSDEIVYVCEKCTKNYKMKVYFERHKAICQGHVPSVTRKNRKRSKAGKFSLIFIAFIAS